MRAFVLASTSPRKWRESGGSGLKQLIRVNGETLAARAYRLAYERCGDVTTVVADPTLACWQGLNPKAPVAEEWMGSQAKLLNTRHLWPESGEVALIYGDAYYTEAVMDLIFEHPIHGVTIFGRAQRGRSEAFGVRFRVPDDTEELERIARECAEVGMNTKGGGEWRWFARKHLGAKAYTKQTRRRLRSVATEVNGWVELSQDATQDFDRLEHLAKWRGQHGLKPERSMMAITLRHEASGRSLEVEDGSRAAALLRQQGWTDVLGPVEAPQPSPATGEAGGIEDEPLEAYTRPQLNERAEQLGVVNPARLRTKGEVIEAIIAAAE